VSDTKATLTTISPRGEQSHGHQTVAAYELRSGWIVLPENGQPRRIALARCQGAQPHVVVHCVGSHERSVFEATEHITVGVNQ